MLNEIIYVKLLAQFLAFCSSQRSTVINSSLWWLPRLESQLWSWANCLTTLVETYGKNIRLMTIKSVTLYNMLRIVQKTLLILSKHCFDPFSSQHVSKPAFHTPHTQMIYIYQDIKINISTEIPRKKNYKTSKKDARWIVSKIYKCKASNVVSHKKESALNMCQTWREWSRLVAKRSYPLMRSRLHLKRRRMEGATKELELSSLLETTGSLPLAPDQDTIGKGAHRRPWI